nr:inactive serine/threonine-protein kinase TEX14-like isoform X2 [Geotrypetes seraphini]
MWRNLLSHCPTELGHVKDLNSSAAYLLDHATKGRSRKVKQLLKQGIDVELQNSAGQTALFLSALFGHIDVTEILLHYRANVNHRCKDGSTPVHAAAFSCRGPILLQLLSAGGDLRLHDQEGRTPRDWAEIAGSEQNAEVLQYIHQYQTQVSLMFQCSNYPATVQIQQRMRSKSLQNLCSLSSLLLSSLRLSFSPSHRAIHRTQQSMEKLCTGSLLCLGIMATTPVADEIELLQVDSEKDQTYESGPYTLMRNLLWRGQFVTVRELKPPPNPDYSKHGTIDLLITEQQHCSHLHHPNLLLLMAVCLSPDLRLVYEKVEVGSLYYLLHKRRNEYPLPQHEMIIRLLLQVCEALMFLHSQGYVHRTTTSHAVHIVTLSSAKLSNLEYMQLSKDKAKEKNWSPPIPPQLYNWLPLEVIQDRRASFKSDCYSFCAVIQEVFTDTVPWNHADGLSIKEMMESGCSLTADCRVPQPYYQAVKTNLSLKARDRTISLPDIRYNLRKDLRDRVSGSRILKFQDQSVPARDLCLGTSRSFRGQQDMINRNIPTSETPVLAKPSQKDLLYYEIDTDSSMSSSERTPNNPHMQDCSITESNMGHSNKIRCDTEEKNNLCDISSTNNSVPHFTLLPQELQEPQAYDSSKISTDSESSFDMEMATDCMEGSEMELCSTNSFCVDKVNAEVLDTSICHPSDSVSFCQDHYLNSLKESASLLEKANTSLECLERHFLISIDTLQEFASHTILNPSLSVTDRQQLGLQKREFVAIKRQGCVTETEKGCSQPQRSLSTATTAGSMAMDVDSTSEVGMSDYEKKLDEGEDVVDTNCNEQYKGHIRQAADLSLPFPDLPPMMCYKKLEQKPAARNFLSTMMGMQYSQSEEMLPWIRGYSTDLPQKKEAYRCKKTTYRCCSVTEKGHKECNPQRSLSLQSFTDLSSHRQAMDAQTEKIQNASKQVLEDHAGLSDCSRNTIWSSPSELEQTGDGPLMQLESLDLMQEIINELNGAGEPASCRIIKIQDKGLKEDSRDPAEKRDGMETAEALEGKREIKGRQDCGDGTCNSVNKCT